MGGSAIEPWILELTSIAALMALVPFAANLENRFPLRRRMPINAVAALIAGAIIFSLLHVAGMTILRAALMPLLMGQNHELPGAPLEVLLFELRKDLFPYVTILIVTMLARRAGPQAGLPQAEQNLQPLNHNITLRSGHEVIVIDPSAYEWARAAGNYVEIAAAGRTFLPRITLISLENLLTAKGAEVVRVHRSAIVNPAMVTTIKPLSGSDFLVRTRDGTEIRGSRRYRARLGEIGLKRP